MRQIRLLLTALLAWLAATAGAQLRVTEHLLIGGGMANNYITDIEEDGRGRIWVATESGLNCYNGFEFQSYNTANSGLNSNMINALYYDAEGDRLWIGTKGSGLSMMDIGSRRITTIGGQNPQANNIMHIAAAADGGLWIVSQTSILRCIGGDSLQTVCSDTGQGFLQCLLDYGDGTLVIGHYLGGISLLDTRTGKTRRPLTADSQLYRETVSDIVKDHQGRTWLATGKGLWYYTPETDRLERFEPMAIGSITDIELIDGGEIWASSTGGVWTADLSKWTARRIPNLRSHGSPTHNVRKIHQDRFGNVWFGSMGNGIDFFSHETPQFARLSERSIWGIYKDDDGVWAGTTDRLMCFRDSMLVREIVVGSPDREGSFVISINSDDEGHLMVSHFGHLLQIDKQSGRIREIRHDDGRPVFSLTFYKDRDGTLWITTREGICTYRHGRLTREEKLNSSLQRQSVNGIRRDRQGKLWVATYENGIYLFDQQQRLLQHLDRQGGLLSNSIQHLHTDPKGGIWLSTPDGMGYIADTSRPEHYEAYGYEQGLRDSYIRAIQEDQEGKVWVSTNNGISLLRQTVEKVGQGFSELNTNGRLRYIITVGDTPQELYYDENVVTTILNNLMSNAVKYTPQGEIELSLTGDERQATITVRDTGYGIAPDALPHIFDRYYQAKGRHQASGTGIGLALVRSLATLHEADVRVESREGEGARFTLTLQKGNTYPNALHKENEELRMKNEESADGTAAEPSDERPLVLVVEDNTEIRRYIASELADDYQVIRASDGKAGLDKAFDRIPDLIITDIMMPVMDGTELCRRLKQDIRTSHIPIVMLTAKDTQADQQEGYESGADSYLTKPFSISMLRARITNLLEARQRMIEKMRNEKLVMSNYDYTQGGMDAQGGTGSSDNSASKTNHNYSLLITNYSLDSFSQLDRQFLTDITAYIEENIADQNLTMAMVGESVHMSHSTLYRKIKALTGLSGNEFIRKVRLRHSLHLMLHEHRNVSEAAYESGFSSLPYFRSCFKEEYGMTPTEYLKTMK